MKKLHIILIVIIAASIGVIISTLTDAGTYVNFEQAFDQPDQEFHVVGQLVKDKEMVYDPQKNTDLFTFYMKDNNSQVKQVFLHKAKPQDFERSEQIVLIGKVQNGDFHAREILMKCPSKYNDGSEGEFVTEEQMKKMMQEADNAEM